MRLAQYRALLDDAVQAALTFAGSSLLDDKSAQQTLRHRLLQSRAHCTHAAAGMGNGYKRESVVKAARLIVRCAVQAEDAAKIVKRFGNVEQSLRGGMQFYADLQVALVLG